MRQAQDALSQLRAGEHRGQPAQLTRYQHASAYYGAIHEPLATHGLSDERITDVAIAQEQIIEQNKVTDWVNNLDVQKKIKRQLDHHFYDVEKQAGAQFDLDQVDAMIDQVVEIAKARDSRNS